MKEFWVYTGLRLLLFLATWGAVTGAWLLVNGSAAAGLTFIIALVISGVGSYFVLRVPRERFAARVEARAAVASRKFEEQRAREDVDG